MVEKINLKVNGRSQQVEILEDEPLLYVLRNKFQLNGPKYGCGKHQCGACMVLVDGKSEFSCIKPAKEFENKEVVTLEGLENNNSLHPVQEAFIEEQAAQCGYCINGVIMTAISLLQESPKPSQEEIKKALQGIICRCGTHTRFLNAIDKASQKLQKA
jgi:nicotinate dehydrogenase subunit A